MLVLSRNVSNPKVYELENYGLLKKGKKLDKVKAISCHVLQDTSTNETTIQKYLENVEPSGSEEVSSSDSDILIDLYLEQEESSHEGESSHEEVQNEFEELEVEGLLEDGGTYYKKNRWKQKR